MRNETAAYIAQAQAFERRQSEAQAARRAGLTPRSDLRMPIVNHTRTPSVRGSLLLASVVVVCGTAALLFVNFIR